MLSRNCLRWSALTLVATVSLSGCVAGYRVTKHVDRATGRTTRTMHGNLITGCAPSPMTTSHTMATIMVGLDLVEIKAPARNDRYSFAVQYRGEMAMQITSGDSLILIADGKRIVFSGGGSKGRREYLPHHRQFSMPTVSEVAWYSVSVDQLRQIIDAQKVSFTLKGQNFDINRCLTHVNQRRFAKFIGIRFKPRPEADPEYPGMF